MTDAAAASTAAGRPLALVTGASTGIGLELARCFAEDGFDLILAADTPLDEARRIAEAQGARVETVQGDLATPEGVDALCEAVGRRALNALAANAGHGLGHAFLDQHWDDIRHVVDTNITSTVALLHRLVPRMRDRGQGRILLTGSIAGLIPGSFQAVYNASKAFVDSFAFALRNELKDTGVTVTCLMPGPTDTDFFARADMLDTSVGQSGHKADPAKVARTGYKAMNDGVGDVVAGLGNKMQAALAAVTPQTVLAEQHRKMAEPKG